MSPASSRPYEPAADDEAAAPSARPSARSQLNAAVAHIKNASCRAATSARGAALRVPTDLAAAARYFRSHPAQLATDIFAGVAVAIMQVPESIAFAFLAGIAPMQGLQSTFWIGLMAGLFGARPGMVSGLAGAMAMVQRGIMVPAADSPLATACPNERMQVLLATMFVVGVFQIVLGLIKAPAALRLLPFPVHVGFANGLAVVVLVAQLAGFKVDAGPVAATESASMQGTCPAVDTPTEPPQRFLRFDELQLYLVTILVVLAMIITHFQSRIPGTLRLGPIKLTGKIVPGSLTAMVITTLVEHLVFRRAFGVHTKTVGDVAVIKGDFSAPTWPLAGIDWSRYAGTIFEYAAMVSAIASIESLMTMQLCADLARESLRKHAGAQELIAQGLGNLIAPFFNCIGGSAMVGQSALTILSGARSRIAAVTAALLIAVILVAAGPAIALLPVATLSGILFVVVLHAFEWRTLRYIFRREMPWGDVVTVVVVSVLAVVVNLAVAVAVGAAWSAIVYAWRASQDAVVERIGVTEIKWVPAGSEVDLNVGHATRAVHLRFTGPLFYASTAALVHDLTLTSPHAVVRPETDPSIVLWDLTHAPVRDVSAVRDLKAAAKAWTTFELALPILRADLEMAALDDVDHDQEKHGDHQIEIARRVLIVGLDHASVALLSRADGLRHRFVPAGHVEEFGDAWTFDWTPTRDYDVSVPVGRARREYGVGSPNSITRRNRPLRNDGDASVDEDGGDERVHLDVSSL
ncbi:hypothetical protein GGF31_005361 [Allomyces arbusculus]|nr:hypothetical protein GGF31_005361 [Allomyces arbusculus]